MSLLTIKDAAAFLNVPAKSLLDVATREGHLIRVGRAVRIRADEIEELVEKCRCRPASPGATVLSLRPLKN